MALATLILGLGSVTGCDTEGLASCADVSWLELAGTGRAELTDAPSFSSSEIARGEPLALEVPGNESTQGVRAAIRSADDANVAQLMTETDGDEVVQLSLDDTDLEPAVYLAYFIALESGSFPNSIWYTAGGIGAPYVLNMAVAPELRRSCVTGFVPNRCWAKVTSCSSASASAPTERDPSLEKSLTYVQCKGY